MLAKLLDMFRRASTPLQYADDMSESASNQQAELIALLQERPGNATWTQLVEAVLEHGSPAEAREQWVTTSLFDADDQRQRIEAAVRDIQRWVSEGLSLHTILDDSYPSRVRDIQEAPPFLFSRGHLPADDVAVSVVGSRQASPKGLGMARSISSALVASGVSVVAGLAAGIDTAAHETALQQGGKTVAVIGTGIHKCYPAANKLLQARIAEEGLLLSQFWPDAPPQRHNFPMRNAVMSGYGIATVVVEAGERSGARIQARVAVRHGRPVILTDLVVDRTEWGKALLRQPDVHLARSVHDVVDLVSMLRMRPSEIGSALEGLAV